MVVGGSGADVRARGLEAVPDPVEVVLRVLLPPAQAVLLEVTGGRSHGLRVWFQS